MCANNQSASVCSQCINNNETTNCGGECVYHDIEKSCKKSKRIF